MDRKFYNWFNTFYNISRDSNNISNQFERSVKNFNRENLVFSYIHLKYCYISDNKYNLSKTFRVYDQIEEYQIKNFIIIFQLLFLFCSLLYPADS
jgi:hypothetical protein